MREENYSLTGGRVPRLPHCHTLIRGTFRCHAGVPHCHPRRGHCHNHTEKRENMNDPIAEAAVRAAEDGAPPRSFDVGPDAAVTLGGSHPFDGLTVTHWTRD